MKQKLQHWLLGLVCAAGLWSSFTLSALASDRLSHSDNRHVLERIGFGVTSTQLKQVKTNGIEAYIQSQLNPNSIQENKILEAYLTELDYIYQDPFKLQRQFVGINKKLKNSQQLSSIQQEALNKRKGNLRRTARDRATHVRLARAIYSHRQLQEVMVDFWFNHFNVFVNKGNIDFWIGDYENDIRTHALGNFRDLLGVVARDPAMLIYLDNQFNTDPTSPQAKGNFKGLNENYARELMELHTLGVDGGYSQDDIIALAKIFTGWTVDYKGNKGDRKGFFFFTKRHDSSDKVFLGHQIKGGGIEEGERALDILATHPATAKFISYKLAQYFVSDRPTSQLVDSLAQKFTESNGNIKTVLNTLIHSSEFQNPKLGQQKFKTPYQYLISLVRMGEIKQANLKRLQGMLRQLSMPIYMCVPPIGYRNTQDAWLDPQAMLQRINLATAIANKALDSNSPIEYKRLLDNIGQLSQHTQQVVDDSNPRNIRTALVLGSPEAMYK